MVEHTLAKYTVIQPKMPTTAANLMVCDKWKWKRYHEGEYEQPLSYPDQQLNYFTILRPSTSARQPLVRAPIIAPIVKTDAKIPNYKVTWIKMICWNQQIGLLSNIIFCRQKIEIPEIKEDKFKGIGLVTF